MPSSARAGAVISGGLFRPSRSSAGALPAPGGCGGPSWRPSGSSAAKTPPRSPRMPRSSYDISSAEPLQDRDGAPAACRQGGGRGARDRPPLAHSLAQTPSNRAQPGRFRRPAGDLGTAQVARLHSLRGHPLYCTRQPARWAKKSVTTGAQSCKECHSPGESRAPGRTPKLSNPNPRGCGPEGGRPIHTREVRWFDPNRAHIKYLLTVGF
jgi:hypothetical protein